jgi:hypothetical protein
VYALTFLSSLLKFPAAPTYVCNVYVAPDAETVCCERSAATRAAGAMSCWRRLGRLAQGGERSDRRLPGLESIVPSTS